MAATLLADLEHVRILEKRATPGEAAPAAQDGTARAFVLLDGELVLELDDGERRARAESCVFVPPGVARAAVVAGDTPAHFLELHLPSLGSRDVVVRRTGGAEGENVTDRPNRRATVLVGTDELTLSEFAYGPGERGADPHVHLHHADAFLVLEGEFAFHLRDRTFPGRAGTLVVFPPLVVHGFDNDGAAPARALNFHMPSRGFADYLRTWNPDFDQHDPPADGGADPAAMVAVRLSA